MLDEYMVFTPTSHSGLQSVRLKWSPVREGSRSAADLAYMQFGLSIGPNAPVREFGVPLNPIGLGPAMATLSDHKCIQVLDLPYTCINVLDVIALVKALPLVSHIHSMTLSSDPFPDNLPEHKLPAYVITNYSNIGKRFRCWRIDTNTGFAFKTVAKWALLLALACPNLGYVAVPASSRELFMAYMKGMIASDGYRQHATRLQRLLFGGWQNSIPSVEAIQAKITTATVSS
ncbi:hypothetical protein GGI24_004150 [Coemansia furcata]|nr:hypothetical protein GGI24_004150 [Coemansia furcata]